MTYGLRSASGHHRRLPSHATSATTLNGIPSGLVTFETWGLGAADFANDDPVGPHRQHELDQCPDRDLATPIGTRWLGLVVRTVRTQKNVKLTHLFDATDALFRRYRIEQGREQRSLTGAGWSGYENRGRNLHHGSEKPGDSRRHRSERDEVRQGLRAEGESANRC